MLFKQHTLLGVLLFAAGAAACAQEFDVASVKPSALQTGRFTMTGGPGTSDPGRINYTNIPLRRVLLNAYDLSNYQITGPDWLDSQRFDIAATIPAGATKPQFQAMLRNLLAARFQMTVHRESRELAVYVLIPAKTGPKLTALGIGPAAESPENQVASVKSDSGKDGFPVLSMPGPGLIIETRNGRARITAKETSLAKFADMLTTQLGRPVLDRTQLTGNFSFELYFTPENSTDVGSEPSLSGAVREQLGLRLEARKAPVELLIIDHVEKVPTGN